jgi:rubrerythrin
MTTLTPTKDTGATVKPAPGLYAEPDCYASRDELAAFMPGSGLNGEFMADQMSSMLTHERCGVHLYRSVAGRTTLPDLRDKYEEFGRQTQRHVEILEAFIVQCGGNPNYVSPAARATEGMNSKILESTFVLNGTVDLETAELTMLNAVFLAESVDHANWELLAQICEALPEGDMRDALRSAVDEVEQEEDAHLDWSRSTKAQLILQRSQEATT